MDYNTTEHSGLIAGIGAFGVIFYLAILVLIYAGLWKMFVKAGKPGWAAIIPIYNILVMIEIVGKPTIWILWLLIPCVNIVFGIWLLNLLMKSFGKSEAFTIGAIILPYVFFPLVGFSDSPYLGPSAAEANGFGGPKNGFGPNNGFNVNDPFNQPPTTPNA